jgi:hypothetical protein
MRDAAKAEALLEDCWLSPAKVANYLDVEVDTLAKWRSKGLGPDYSASLTRDPRYRLSDVARFMAEGVVSNTTAARYRRKELEARRTNDD